MSVVLFYVSSHFSGLKDQWSTEHLLVESYCMI